MDRTSKRVLKYLCKYNVYNNYAFFFVDGHCQEFAERLDMLEIELKQCISYLHKEEYVDYTFTGEQVTGFVLTHKGLHFQEIRKEEHSSILIKAMIIPVIVGILIATLPDVLEHTLQLIQQWLSSIL